MNTRETLKINGAGHLEIGGCDTVELAQEFGTPLYVFDEAHFMKLATLMRGVLRNEYGEGEIAYASKAFACKAVLAMAREAGLSADVVSGGELYIAKQSAFDISKIYFHGNAKTNAEIDEAVSSGVGAIVIESADEAVKISASAKRYGVLQGVMVRVNPMVEAHTHSFVQTANTDSKFGVQLGGEELLSLIKKINADKNLSFSGLHVHIGSQIFDIEPYLVTCEKLVRYIKTLENEGISVKKLNLGGGFGITYTDSDPQFKDSDYARFISEISKKLLSLIKQFGITKPALVFEPGRSLVGEAGITLYTVCAIKNIPDIRKYVSVDGGMTDNPRYALYGARYEAAVCCRAAEKKIEKVTIAGKCCESGDIITADAMLQPANIGDTLAVFSTGAYNYSMASNYNSNAVPPVVTVLNGKAEYIVKPQTYRDIVRNNVLPDRLK